MKNNPLLSVVIPTKNRYSTLEHVIQKILSWKSDDFELLIQDNSDNNKYIIDFLANYNLDTRLSYFYSSKKMDAVQNCDLAIKNSKGQYVIFIGDDDGLSFEIIRFTKFLLQNNIDSAYFNIASYLWPELRLKFYGSQFASKLLIKPFTKTVFRVDTTKELKKLTSLGAQVITNIPRVYKGVVSRKALNLLFTNCGSYFPGPVPDMSNAVALVPFVNCHIYCDFPIVITGASKNSMAGKGALKKHHGEIKSNKTLPENTLENWNKTLPQFWSSPTIWADGALKGLKNSNQVEAYNNFNFERVYSALIIYVGKYRKQTFKKLKQLKKEKVSISYSKIMAYMVIILLKRLKTLVQFKLSKIGIQVYWKEIFPANNVGDAMTQLDNYLKKEQIEYNLQ